MKRDLFLIFALFISSSVMAQSPGQRFVCQGQAQGFTQNQVENIIAGADFEGMRLQNQRDTLSFDNGFNVILLSASELQTMGIPTNTASYQIALPRKYKKPTYHINPSGQLTAEYVVSSKYSGQ